MSSDLTISQMLVIKILCRATKPMKLGEVSVKAGRSAGAVSRASLVLEAKGYVDIRTHEEEPGRPKFVRLTTKGKKNCQETVR